MNKKSILSLSTLLFFVSISTGCGKLQNGFNRWSSGVLVGDYVVRVYGCSDKPVSEYHIKNGFVNSDETSDGYFFTDEKGKLVQVSGTVTIEQE